MSQLNSYYRKGDIMHNALLLVDIQNDFMPGGALPVPRANEIIEPINRMMGSFDWILASKDWHPCDHVSFARTWNKEVGETIQIGQSKQTLWPVHCVEDTDGSEHPEHLETGHIHHTFYKGCNRHVESSSIFLDKNGAPATPIDTFLSVHQISDLYVVGIATEYCVKSTVLDALKLGYKVQVLEDCCRGIDPKNEKAAYKEMEAAGARVLQSAQARAALTAEVNL